MMRRSRGESQPSIKRIAWCGSALEDIRSFPDEARREAGFQLGELQEGRDPDDWKPMSVVGPGTIEMWIHTGVEHRVFVVTKFAGQVYVLHAFEKKSQQTARRDIDLARQRYRQVVMEERER